QHAQRLAQGHVGLLGPSVDDRKQFAAELIGVAFHERQWSRKKVDCKGYFALTPFFQRNLDIAAASFVAWFAHAVSALAMASQALARSSGSSILARSSSWSMKPSSTKKQGWN